MKKYKYKVLFLFSDIIFINLVYFISYYLRFEGVVPLSFIEIYYNNILMITAIKVAVLWYFKIYNNLWSYASIEEMIQLIIAIVISNILASSYIMIYVIYNNLVFPRSIYILALTFDSILLGGTRFTNRVLRTLSKKNKVDNGKVTRVMVIGAGEAGSTIIKELNMHKKGKVVPVVLVDDDVVKWDSYIHGIIVKGDTSKIDQLSKEYNVNEIIIAIPSASSSDLKRIIMECKKTGCMLKTLPGVYELLNENITLNKIRDVQIEDLLGRNEVKLDIESISGYIKEKTVLVTGGGGSIGSELCRQIAKFNPAKLVILDIYENNVYDLENELKRKYDHLNYKVIIASVRDQKRIEEVIRVEEPNVVFHAAAHKHVPLMESNPKEAIKNNVFGTYNTINAALKNNVEKFVLISTDKAVNPTNIMGASKRVCEMLIQAYSKRSTKTEFAAVRFGNVLGSNGSVIPLFKKQIQEGGPITVTHPEIIRYFMTIPEAARLVIQAGAIAKGGEIFVLDMGNPVKIFDLANDLIRLSGLVPDIDIKIDFTGLRPGEKLYEELLLDDEIKETTHEKIYVGKSLEIELPTLEHDLLKIEDIIRNGTDEDVRSFLEYLVPTYNPNKKEKDMMDEIAATKVNHL